MQRRLAQNREAARKSRQRKKDYMKQLEIEVRRRRNCSAVKLRVACLGGTALRVLAPALPPKAP